MHSKFTLIAKRTKSFVAVLSLLLTTTAANSTVYYVDAARPDNNGNGLSWATAKRDVQDGINAAVNNGDEVWVKAGFYLATQDPNGNPAPAENRDKALYIKNNDIKLYGGFAGTETSAGQRSPADNLTVLSGDLDGPLGTANGYHVLMTLYRSSACVVDGFTIQEGRAAGGATNFTVTVPAPNPATDIARTVGGGIVNWASFTQFSNCIVMNNGAAGAAGGMACTGGSEVFTNCVFANNFAQSNGGGMSLKGMSAGTALTNCIVFSNTGSNGAGIYNESTSPTLTNCVVISNGASMNGGGMNSIGTAANPVIRNCTINGNTAAIFGSGLYYGNTCGGSIINSILFNNASGNTGDANREEIFKLTSGSTLTVSFTLVRDYMSGSTSFVTNGGGIYGPPFAPTYNNPGSPMGPDGRWLTADDGYGINCGAVGVDAGSGTVPALDIVGNTRKAPMDLGAYEAVGGTTPSNSTSGVYTSVALTQPSGSQSYTDCVNELLRIEASGPNTLTGSVTARQFIEPSVVTFNGLPHVRRYYDITPVTNPSSATATITLYYTQADFDDYNANRGTRDSLPVDPADARNFKANVRMEQQHGSSESGAPNTYRGFTGSGPANVTIIPSSVVWNATASRWEVTLPVTGFSGFFITTPVFIPLPVKLLSFGGRAEGQRCRLDWSTATEDPGTVFEVTRSSNGTGFRTIGTVSGTGGNAAYSYYDAMPAGSVLYYRLKITENGQSVTYSKTIAMATGAQQGGVTVAPVPADSKIVITNTDGALNGTTATLTDWQGRVVATVIIAARTELDLTTRTAGIYSLRLVTGEVIRVVKQ